MQDIAQELIQKASTGDSQAFKEIYKVSCGFVYSTAFRMAANKNDAEDITQEVFIKIYDNLKKFQFKSSLKTWIYRITVNTAINFITRVKKNAEKNSTNEVIEHAAVKPENSPGAFKNQENQELVEYLLKKLNPEQRSCVILREIEGLSYQEIAKALNVNINTVRSRLKRARESLINLKNEEVIKNEL